MDKFIKVAIVMMVLCTIGCLAQPYPRPITYYAPAPVGHDGRVVDTPEVAQAKAAHLAAFSRLSTHPAAAAPTTYYQGAPNNNYLAAATPVSKPVAYEPQGAYSNPGYFSSRIQHGPYGYDGPPAPLAQDGRVIDTPEVAQAKAAHFAAFSQAAARAYNAPVANNPPATYNHPATYNNNNHLNSNNKNHKNYNNNDDYNTNNNYNSNDEEYNDYSSGPYSDDDDEDSSGSEEGYETRQSTQYQGPPAPLARDGRVIDTPEVAQARAAHLAAYQRASHGRSTSYQPRGSYY